MTDQIGNVTSKKRWAFRYSLRTFLILVAIIAAILGLRYRSHAQHSAARILKHRGVHFAHSLYWKQSFWSRLAFGDNSFDEVGIQIDGTTLTSRELELLRNFPNVTHVVLRKVGNADQVLAFYGQQKTVSDVHVEDSELSTEGLQQLVTMPALHRVELRYLQFDRLELNLLTQLPKLDYLVLWGNGVNDDVIRTVADCPGIVGIWIHDTQVTDAGIAALSKLTKLEVATLRKSPFSGSGLSALAELKDLDRLGLTWSQIDDQGLESIKHLRGLRTLDLGETNVSQAGVESLKAALPKCSIASDFDPRPY